MNKINYQINISYTKRHKHIIIEIFRDKHYIVTFYIEEDNSLKLNCYVSDNDIDLYESAINYIIDNKIGKFSHIGSNLFNDLIIYFDIIDTELLLQLL